MFDGFDKLPQFVQLCIGIGCVFGAAYAIIAAIKARKIFSPADRDQFEPGKDLRDLLSDSRKIVYDRMEMLFKRIDERYDGLEDRVRLNEQDIAVLKNQTKSLENAVHILENPRPRR